MSHSVRKNRRAPFHKRPVVGCLFPSHRGRLPWHLVEPRCAQPGRGFLSLPIPDPVPFWRPFTAVSDLFGRSRATQVMIWVKYMQFPPMFIVWNNWNALYKHMEY